MGYPNTLHEWQTQPNVLLQKLYLPEGLIGLIDIKKLNLADKKVFQKIQNSFYQHPELWCHFYPSLDIGSLATMKSRNHLVYDDLKKNNLLTIERKEYLIKNSNFTALLKIDPDLVHASTPSFNPEKDDHWSYLHIYKASIKDNNKIEEYMGVWETLYMTKKQRKNALLELNDLISLNPLGLNDWFAKHLNCYHSILKETIISTWFNPSVKISRNLAHLKTLEYSHAYNAHAKDGKLMTQLKRWKKSFAKGLEFHPSSLFTYIDSDDDMKKRFFQYVVLLYKKKCQSTYWLDYDELVPMEAWIDTMITDIPVLSMMVTLPNIKNGSNDQYKQHFTSQLQIIGDYINSKNKPLIIDEIELNF